MTPDYFIVKPGKRTHVPYYHGVCNDCGCEFYVANTCTSLFWTKDGVEILAKCPNTSCNPIQKFTVSVEYSSFDPYMNASVKDMLSACGKAFVKPSNIVM